LVKFVQLSSAWFGVLVVSLFFLIVILAFVPGINLSKFFGKGNWFAWVLLVLMFSFLFLVLYIFGIGL